MCVLKIVKRSQLPRFTFVTCTDMNNTRHVTTRPTRTVSQQLGLSESNMILICHILLLFSFLRPPRQADAGSPAGPQRRTVPLCQWLAVTVTIRASVRRVTQSFTGKRLWQIHSEGRICSLSAKPAVAHDGSAGLEHYTTRPGGQVSLTRSHMRLGSS
jgi:hypothetical protein